MSKPNVIVLVIDDVKASHLSMWGYQKETTPFLQSQTDLLTRYQWAFATSNWSGPSHASIFTGQYPSEHGVIETGDRLRNQETIATFAKDRGYRTFASSPCPHVLPATNFSQGVDQFIVTYEKYKDLTDFSNLKALTYELLMGFESRVYYSLLKFQEFVRSGHTKPFFAFMNFNTAHAPYQPPKPFGRKFYDPQEHEVDVKRLRALTGERQTWNGFLSKLGFKTKPVFDPKYRYQYYEGLLDEVSEVEQQVLKSWYDGCLAYMDRRIEELFGFLSQAKLFDDTVIFIMADHGEMFGERRNLFHSISLFNSLIHVPLLVKYPVDQQPKFKTWNDNVSLIDVLPTIKTLLGDKQEIDLIHPDKDRVVYSEENSKVLKGYRKLFPRSKRIAWYEGAKKAIIKGDYKYIEYETGEKELYNIKKDYSELNNLSQSEKKLFTQMEADLHEWNGKKKKTERKQIEEALYDINL